MCSVVGLGTFYIGMAWPWQSGWQVDIRHLTFCTNFCIKSTKYLTQRIFIERIQADKTLHLAIVKRVYYTHA